ncbi:hypothetical protein Mgra_00000510 [Meloidogyne graminicola]|uniref:Uncharacterized protein n=1 Tax=Meloidogyne graminicola TaxID=189291 RepID=A0A8T0A2K4_9BILA|nr:hypothetical protein Mgra_00000510 [Meloidogyne graminicola]
MKKLNNNQLNNKSFNSLKYSSNNTLTTQQSSPKITFENFLGQGRMNQLGGVFINGRPLPQEKRLQIVEMARRGIKPCKISRELKVSHGAVSKILMRYNETGSISPGQIGGNPRSRISIQAVRQYILRILNEQKNNKNISAQQIQQILVQRGICSEQNVPSTSRINRLLKTQKYLKEKNEIIKENKQIECLSEQQQILTTKPLSHSIENILNKTINNNNNNYSNTIDISKEIQQSTTTTTTITNSIVSSNIPFLNKFNDLNNKSISIGSDEENYQQQQSILTPENKRSRTAFNQEQLRLLENVFNENPYPLAEQKEWLVKSTNLDEDKIITWFSNRRARSRRKALQNGLSNYQNFFFEANNFLLPKIKESSSVNLINKNIEETIIINNNQQQQQKQQIQQQQQQFNNNNNLNILFPSFNISKNIPVFLSLFPSLTSPLPSNISNKNI